MIGQQGCVILQYDCTGCILLLRAPLSMRLKTVQQLVLPFKLHLYVQVQCIHNMLKYLKMLLACTVQENRCIKGHWL
uniref:Uncharacterized protein n=1 Tax=Amphimedon queenslandica TaxID=400682 RepID=A0A1X7UCU0_AMPQE